MTLNRSRVGIRVHSRLMDRLGNWHDLSHAGHHSGGDPMTEHLPECPLGQPCQSSEPDHVMQGTIAGIPVTVCGLCMADCICDRLRQARDRGYSEAMDDGWGEPEHIRQAVAAAIDAAREAVDFVTVFIADVGENGKPDLRQMIHVGSALAAIDALKENHE